MQLLRLAAAVLLALGAATLPATAEKRVALVIGNGAYEHADKLTNPVTDSRNLRDALKKDRQRQALVAEWCGHLCRRVRRSPCHSKRNAR
jgi:hypothetical protein